MNAPTSTTPAAPRQFSVANKTLSTANSDTGGQILKLNSAAQAITNQANFPTIPDQPTLDNLNTHLATAQGHANAWLNTYSGQVLDTLQGVVTFGELFTNLYNPLHAAAQGLATQSGFQPNQIATLISMIQALQQQVQGQQNRVQGTLTNMQTYRTGVSADYASFQTDYTAANTALNGTTGLVAQLQAKIDADHSAMNKDLDMIAGGSLMMVVGILVVAVGALAEIETAGLATGLIVGGVALIGGGAAMTGVGGKNYDDMLSTLSSDTTQLAQANSDITYLATLKTSFTNLDSQLMQTQTLLGTIITAWQELFNSLGAVVSDLQNPENYLQTVQKDQPSATPLTVSIIVTAELETAFQDWTASLQNAQTQLQNLRSPVVLNLGNKAPTQANIEAAYTQHLASLAAAA